MRRLPNADASDAVAEVFVIAWDKRDATRPPDILQPWLYGIARNVIRHAYRGNARRQRLSAKLGGIAPSAQLDPAQVVVQRSEDEAMIHSLSRLASSDQEILRLRAWEELTGPQIAEVLGISVAAAEKRISRAVDRLRRQLPPAADTRPAHHEE
jgi:RNA polymerase sigma-70 factor (ECF subfamily)